jgi:acyl transferase domain-containing protein
MPSPSRHGFPVAVIGIACRFPGAVDKEAFWRNLASGLDSVSTVPPSRWDAQAYYVRRHEPGKTVSQWGGFIDDVERVNPALFGMGPEEAADLDPLIRLFTETSLAAVLDSPYDQASLKGRRVGVFAGARASRYAERIVSPTKHSVTGVGQNFIAAFVSHVLDLRGPSLVLDSACSSSLAAVHLACQSLYGGDSDLAIAGGVDVLLDEKSYLFLSAAHALSPDGRCRTFDEKANGFVPGEGVGCVLLKPLAQAMADGDHVYAVIDGSAINNDGHTLGVTTPGVEGQVDVIERAWQKAGVPPNTVSYVEAHGTGTMIGDPIELRALARAFAKDPPASCAIGSVKTNVGHLLSAAGIASLIKVVLALHHRTLPPTLHCEQVNPRFDFDRTPFRPVVKARPWAAQEGVRRAGISAFGFGKTNVHVVVSERPDEARRPVDLPAAKPAVADRDKIYAWRSAVPSSVSSQPSVSSQALLALESFTVELLAEA